MSLTYDQMSELSMAFQEAHVPADRRRSNRIKQRIAAEITEWSHTGQPGRSFGVMIEDFSTTGVGMTHSGRLKPGHRYTLEIPRPAQPPIRLLLVVVRCDELDGGLFTTQMQASEILAGRGSRKAKPRPRRAAAILLALLAFAATAAALYFDLL
jgi:hypothetical protein